LAWFVATISRYRVYLLRRIKDDPALRRELETLRGRRLGCWCKPGPCHGEVIAELLNEFPTSAAQKRSNRRT